MKMHTMHGAAWKISRSMRDLEVAFFGARCYFQSRSTGTLHRSNGDDGICPMARKDRVNRDVAVTRDRVKTAKRLRSNADGCALAKREPPEPRGLPFVGTTLSFLAAGGAHKLHEYVDRRHRQLGPVYREQIGPVRGVFVKSANEFRRIFRLEGVTPYHFLPESWTLYNELRQRRRGLLFMDGEEWLYYRRILNKVMLVTDSKKLMCMPCQEAAESLTGNWKVQGNVIENLERQLYQWSIEVMLATLVGSSWHHNKQEMTAECKYLALMLHQILKNSAILSMISAKLAMRLRLPIWTKFVIAADAVFDTVNNLVPKIIRLKGDGLLQAMMNAGIRDDDAARIIGDFIIAAGDTTAVTMQWALLLLSSRPKLQNELFDDIKDLSTEEILQHNLLKGVVRETLRLYPVAPFITRYLMEDSFIDNYFISKGELLIMSIYSSSRDAKSFPQPNEFQPERWLRTVKGSYQAVTNPHATLPFAMGARSCIGRRLAETQICLALAQLIKNFKIECENRDNIKMILHLISVPSEPVQLKLTAREEQKSSMHSAHSYRAKKTIDDEMIISRKRRTYKYVK